MYESLGSPDDRFEKFILREIPFGFRRRELTNEGMTYECHEDSLKRRRSASF